MNVLLIVAVVFCVVDFVLLLLATALPYWFSVDISGSDVYFGLWEKCQSINNDDYVCRSLGSAGETIEAWWDAVGALMIIALFFTVFGLILGICILACLRYNIIMYIIAAVCVLFSAICSFIALVVFGAKFDDGNNMDGSNLHAGYYLAIFGCLFAIVTGILYIVSKPKLGTPELFEE